MDADGQHAVCVFLPTTMDAMYDRRAGLVKFVSRTGVNSRKERGIHRRAPHQVQHGAVWLLDAAVRFWGSTYLRGDLAL